MKIFFALLINILLVIQVFAQIPTTQDCKGAIPVCDYIYVEDSTAAGHGNYLEIPNGGNSCPNHCMDGEHNSRWYIWTVVQSGELRFEITPQVQTDDYDWAVFNLTNYTCDDIWNTIGNIMSSCNAAGGGGYQGTTGVSTLNGGNNNCNNGGPTNKWNADMSVTEGETYVLVISDWTQTPGGYTLDFSASTAVIFDDQKPYIEYIGGDLITSCGTNELSIKFNENIKCTSIQSNDFKLEGPGGPYVVDSIYGETCDLGGNNEREYTLYFTPAIFQGGDYTLEIKQFSFISDACNNYANSDLYNFYIDLNSPDADAGEDIDIPYAATATLDGTVSNGSGTYFYSWEPPDLLTNPNIQNPTTVSMTSSTEFVFSVSDQETACMGEDTVWVNVVGGPLGITMSTSSNEICNGDRVDLFVFPDGGSGSYDYIWTSNPVGFNSTVQNPSDFPETSIWYILNITDGYTDIIDSIYVIVNQIPFADAGIDQVINEGTITTLDGSASGGNGDKSFQWEPASWLQSSNIPNPTTLPLFSPTVFSLWVTDGKNCISEPDNVLINASGGGLAAFPWSDSSEICYGETTTIYANASGGGMEYTYDWTSDPTGFTSTNPSFSVTPSTTTTYNLLLKDQFDNEVMAYITIIVNPLPIIILKPDGANMFGPDTMLACVRDTVVLDAGFDSDPLNTEYFWLENNFENRYNIASTNGSWIDFQKHTVRVTDGYSGCKNTGGITILFHFDECAIGVPENSFDLEEIILIHPNPNNGSFTIKTTENLSDLELNMFDAYGKLIFRKNINGDYLTGSSLQISDDFNPGIYYLHFKSGLKTFISKVIIY